MGSLAPRRTATLERGEFHVGWCPDAACIVVTKGEGRPSLRLLRLELDGGARRPWKELRVPDPTGVAALDMVYHSPSWHAYAYRYRRALSDLYLVEGLP